MTDGWEIASTVATIGAAGLAAWTIWQALQAELEAAIERRVKH